MRNVPLAVSNSRTHAHTVCTPRSGNHIDSCVPDTVNSFTWQMGQLTMQDMCSVRVANPMPQQVWMAPYLASYRPFLEL